MKRKFFIGGAALLFAAATLFNMSFLTGNNARDASLESIAVMARAWNELPEVTIECSGGSDGQCFVEVEPDYDISPIGIPYCSTVCEFSGDPTDACAEGMPC